MLLTNFLGKHIWVWAVFHIKWFHQWMIKKTLKWSRDMIRGGGCATNSYSKSFSLLFHIVIVLICSFILYITFIRIVLFGSFYITFKRNFLILLLSGFFILHASLPFNQFAPLVCMHVTIPHDFHKQTFSLNFIERFTGKKFD